VLNKVRLEKLGMSCESDQTGLYEEKGTEVLGSTFGKHQLQEVVVKFVMS